MTDGNGLESVLLGSHEGRLQRVEHGVADCQRSLATTQVRLEGLQQQVQAGNEAILEKVNAGFGVVLARLDAGAVVDRDLQQQVGTQGAGLEKLQHRAAANSKRRASIKNASIGLILAGSGAALKHLGDHLWTWLSK